LKEALGVGCGVELCDRGVESLMNVKIDNTPTNGNYMFTAIESDDHLSIKI